LALQTRRHKAIGQPFFGGLVSDPLRVTPAHSVDSPDSDDAHDLVWGALAIGAVINRNRRRTYHLLESGALGDAVRKIGAHWVGSRRKLLALMCGEQS
jgi:hypothetical protein